MIKIELSDIEELANGERPEIEVGTLPIEVRQHFGCSRDTVFLTKYSLDHIFKRHSDHVARSDLLLLPKILQQGLWLADRQPTHAIISCVVTEIRYKSVVKVTSLRDRAFISTMHRIAPRQTKRLLKKATILRNAW